MRSRDHIDSIALQARACGVRVPLAAMQMNQLQLQNGAGFFHSKRMCLTAVRAIGHLDTSLLRSCIEAVVRRHESLRTNIVMLEGIPRQHISDAQGLHWEVVDLTHLSLADADSEVKRLAEELAGETIDVSKDALFATRLFRLSATNHVLLCALDHLISDGTSLGLLDQEIWTLYGQGARGLPFSLPSLKLQFADYAVWQEAVYPNWLAKHQAYWTERLSTATRMRIPYADEPAMLEGGKRSRLEMSFGQELSANLRRTATEVRASVSFVVCTVYLIVVSRWCGQRNLLLPMISTARYRSELHSMIGFLASILRLRITIAADETFSSLLRRLNHEFYTALSHDDLGWIPDFLPDWSFRATDLVFNWLPRFGGRQFLPGGQLVGDEIRLEAFSVQPPGRSRFSSVFCDTPEQIILNVHYMPQIVPTHVVERFGQELRFFAEEFVRSPQGRIDRYQ